MDRYNSIRNWVDVGGLAVTIRREGRRLGNVDDFYFKDETNAIYALRVKIGFLGFKALVSSAIRTIEPDAVTVASDQMLIDESNGGELDQLPLGNNLIASQVISESGTFKVTISNI